jgi:organic hydroperoxide reductase OsmC/OhrA
MSQVITSHPNIKRKSFTYHTELQWLENHTCRLESDNKESFRVTSPPEFEGENDEWTPEDLFVGAINACTMTTFLAYASKKHLDVCSYKSKAEGLLEFSGGHYKFTQIRLTPVIVVETNEAASLTEQIIHKAHDNCFISNSVSSKVLLEPEIKILSKREQERLEMERRYAAVEE